MIEERLRLALLPTSALRLLAALGLGGYGLSASWPAYPAAGAPGWLPPLIRIDYIWHNDAFRAVQAAVGPELGSDHFPQYATLVLCADHC